MIGRIKKLINELADDKTQTKAFKDWFDGSKIVDEAGNPLLLYHETSLENSDSIKRNGFDVNLVGARKGGQ